MIARFAQLRAACADRQGMALIETAIVAPVLLLLSLGAFQISGIVARQSELQSAVSEAEAIALAAAPDTAEKLTALQNVLITSTGLNADKVLVGNTFRCAAADAYVAAKTGCASTDKVSTYVRIQIQDTYTPIWAQYGVGQPMSFNIIRYVLVDQKANI